MPKELKDYPHYEYPEGIIYNADCLEIMPLLKNQSIDLVLTDPPYGQGREFEGEDYTNEQLVFLLEDAGREIERITRYNFCVEVAKNKLPLFTRAFHTLNYEYCLVLHTTNDIRNGKVGFSCFSLLLWYSMGKRKINRYRDLIATHFVNNKEISHHPTPKNVRHYKKIIEMFSNPPDTILDPFMGSGTTGVACKELGRKFIGIEIEPKYFEIAQRRINNTTKNLL